jgi:hypothetical protein
MEGEQKHGCDVAINLSQLKAKQIFPPADTDMQQIYAYKYRA